MERVYQQIVNHTIRWLDYIHEITVSIDPTKPYGLGFPRDKRIVMPSWVDKYDPMYRVYYVLHEFCHCIVGVKHDEVFMRVEDAILALWDLKIIRKKVYPRALYWKDKEILNIPVKEKYLRYLKNKIKEENNIAKIG